MKSLLSCGYDCLYRRWGFLWRRWRLFFCNFLRWRPWWFILTWAQSDHPWRLIRRTTSCYSRWNYFIFLSLWYKLCEFFKGRYIRWLCFLLRRLFLATSVFSTAGNGLLEKHSSLLNKFFLEELGRDLPSTLVIIAAWRTSFIVNWVCHIACSLIQREKFGGCSDLVLWWIIAASIIIVLSVDGRLKNLHLFHWWGCWWWNLRWLARMSECLLQCIYLLLSMSCPGFCRS